MRTPLLTGFVFSLALLSSATAQEKRFERLAFTPPAGWTVKEIKEGGRSLWQLSSSLKVRVLVSKPGARGERSLEKWASAIATALDSGRRLLGASEPRARTTSSGITYAFRGQLSEKDERRRSIFVIVVGLPKADSAQIQVIRLYAGDSDALAEAAEAIATSLDKARVLKASAPTAPPARPRPRPRPQPTPTRPQPTPSRPARPQPGTNTFSDQGVLGTNSVASVPKSVKLDPIPFTLGWTQSYEWGAGGRIDYVADPAGNVAVLRTGRLGNGIRKDEAQAHVFLKRGSGLVPSALSVKAVEALLVRSGGAPEHGWGVRSFSDMRADVAGNVFARVAPTFGEHDAYVSMRGGKLELVVHPNYLGTIAKGMGLRRGQLRHLLRPTPQGEAWLIAWNRFGAQLRVEVLRRGSDGKWRPTRITPRVNLRGQSVKAPTGEEMRRGAPDWRGGWVFHGGSTLWRLNRQGELAPRARFVLDAENAVVTDPVVMPNGDVWFAVNRRFSRNSSTDSLGRTHIFALLGDRSRWIRVRLKGESATVGEISSERLLAAWRAAGAKVADSNVVKTVRLVYDPHTKGLMAHDRTHGLLFVVKPR